MKIENSVLIAYAYMYNNAYYLKYNSRYTEALKN